MMLGTMKVAFFLAVLLTFTGGKLSLPIGQENAGQDLATRCVVEVLSKALAKLNSPSVNPECRDFLRAGLKHEVEKKSEENTEVVGEQNEEEFKRQAEVTGIREENPEISIRDSKNNGNFMEVLEKKEQQSQNGGSEETITSSEEKRSTDHHSHDDDEDVGDEVARQIQHSESGHKPSAEEVRDDHHELKRAEHSEKKQADAQERSDNSEENEEHEKIMWSPTHGYHHEKQRQSEDFLEDEAPGVSEEGESEEREKRIWKPAYRYHKKHRQSEDSMEDEEPDESEGESEEREKRIWKPSHRYHHKKHKRSEDSMEDEEPYESKGESEEREKRIWKPTYRHHHKKHRRNEDSMEDEEPDESESESEEREKRIWEPSHRYHRKKHRRSEDSNEDKQPVESEGESEEREKRIWKPSHRYHHKKYRRSEDSSENEQDEDLEEDEEGHVWNPVSNDMKHKQNRGSSEEEDFEFSEHEKPKGKRIWRPMYGYHYKKQRKNDSSEEKRYDDDHDDKEEEDNENSQSYYGRGKKHSKSILEEIYKHDNLESDGELSKRNHHLDMGHHSPQYEKQSQEEEKHHDEESENEKIMALKYLVEKRNEVGRQNEEEMQAKRSPWEYKGYYHPAWWKRGTLRDAADETEEVKQLEQSWWNRRQATMETVPHYMQNRPYRNSKMEELAKLLKYKKAEIPEFLEPKRSLHQRPLTSEEEKELENLTAMDMELQKIAERIHENQRE